MPLPLNNYNNSLFTRFQDAGNVPSWDQIRARADSIQQAEELMSDPMGVQPQAPPEQAAPQAPQAPQAPPEQAAPQPEQVTTEAQPEQVTQEPQQQTVQPEQSMQDYREQIRQKQARDQKFSSYSAGVYNELFDEATNMFDAFHTSQDRMEMLSEMNPGMMGDPRTYFSQLMAKFNWVPIDTAVDLSDISAVRTSMLTEATLEAKAQNGTQVTDADQKLALDYVGNPNIHPLGTVMFVTSAKGVRSARKGRYYQLKFEEETRLRGDYDDDHFRDVTWNEWKANAGVDEVGSDAWAMAQIAQTERMYEKTMGNTPEEEPVEVEVVNENPVGLDVNSKVGQLPKREQSEISRLKSFDEMRTEKARMKQIGPKIAEAHERVKNGFRASDTLDELIGMVKDLDPTKSVVELGLDKFLGRMRSTTVELGLISPEDLRNVDTLEKVNSLLAKTAGEKAKMANGSRVTDADVRIQRRILGDPNSSPIEQTIAGLLQNKIMVGRDIMFNQMKSAAMQESGSNFNIAQFATEFENWKRSAGPNEMGSLAWGRKLGSEASNVLLDKFGAPQMPEHLRGKVADEGGWRRGMLEMDKKGIPMADEQRKTLIPDFDELEWRKGQEHFQEIDPGLQDVEWESLIVGGGMGSALNRVANAATVPVAYVSGRVVVLGEQAMSMVGMAAKAWKSPIRKTGWSMTKQGLKVTHKHVTKPAKDFAVKTGKKAGEGAVMAAGAAAAYGFMSQFDWVKDIFREDEDKK